MTIRQDGALDFISLGALVHPLDPGIIPFRKATQCQIHVSGGEFNVAANLAGLGAEVEVFGVRGDDDAGVALEALVKAAGASVAGLAIAPRPTTVKTRIMAGGYQATRQQVDNLGDWGPFVDESERPYGRGAGLETDPVLRRRRRNPPSEHGVRLLIFRLPEKLDEL